MTARADDRAEALKIIYEALPEELQCKLEGVIEHFMYSLSTSRKEANDWFKRYDIYHTMFEDAHQYIIELGNGSDYLSWIKSQGKLEPYNEDSET